MMSLMLDYMIIFLICFIGAAFAFTFYHENQTNFDENEDEDEDEEEDDEEEDDDSDESSTRLKRRFLLAIGFVWRATYHALLVVDRFVMNRISRYVYSYFCIEQYLISASEQLDRDCSTSTSTTIDDDEDIGERDLAKIRHEIAVLSQTIYDLYIDVWYRVALQLDEGQNQQDGKRINFKNYCIEMIEETLSNFYRLCSETAENHHQRFSDQFIAEIIAHLGERNDRQKYDDQLETKDEIGFLLHLLDDTFRRVLPDDVNRLVIDCDCCGELKRGKKDCLRKSNNPVRLFIYNLIVYSLLLPLIDRITHPLYVLYHCIAFAAHFGGISHAEFIAHFDEDGDDVEVEVELGDGEKRQATQSQLVPSIPVIENEDLDDSMRSAALYYEAIEESRKELMLFSNLRVTDANLSTNNHLHSSASPYIEYTIIFNVLECDSGSNEPKYDNGARAEHSFITRTYQVKRRFREFISFQQKMEKHSDFRPLICAIADKPTSIQFHRGFILDYMKLTKITENSALVKLRKDLLQNFLNHLASHKIVNESKELCEFLGYQHNRLPEVRQLLVRESIALPAPAQQSAQLDAQHVAPTPPQQQPPPLEPQKLRKQKFTGNFKNFDFNLTKNLLKDMFKILLPPQAKTGQLSTQIEDLVANAAVRSKYSISVIRAHCDPRNHMIMRQKLDRWYEANFENTKFENCDKSNQNEQQQRRKRRKTTRRTNASMRLNRTIVSCILLLIFNRYLVFHRYLVRRCAFVFKYFLNSARKIFTFPIFFKFYLHYLHSVLRADAANDETVDTYLLSYERFHLLLKDKRIEELSERYVELSKTKILTKYESEQKWHRARLVSIVFRLFDRYRLIDNLIASFDTHRANKALIYKLLQMFRNKIKT